MLRRAALKSSRPPSTYGEVSSASCNPREGGTRRRFTALRGISAKGRLGRSQQRHGDSDRSEARELRTAPRTLRRGTGGSAAADGRPAPVLSGASCPEPTAACCLPTEAWASRISEPARPGRAGNTPPPRSCQHRLPRSPAPRAATGSRSHHVVSSSRGRAHRAPAPACRAPSLLLPSGLNETPPTALQRLRECESLLQRLRPRSPRKPIPDVRLHRPRLPSALGPILLLLCAAVHRAALCGAPCCAAAAPRPCGCHLLVCCVGLCKLKKSSVCSLRDNQHLQERQLLR